MSATPRRPVPPPFDEARLPNALATRPPSSSWCTCPHVHRRRLRTTAEDPAGEGRANASCLRGRVLGQFTGAGLQPNDQGTSMAVMRSRYAGLHWTAPVQIAPIQTARLFVRDDNFPIRAGDYLPDIAVDPTNGNI